MGSGEKDHCHQAGPTKTHEGQDSKAMGDMVIATFGIIHSKGQCPMLLPTDVTEQLFVKAGLDSPMVFPTAMLVGRDSTCPFTMGQRQPTNILVADLEFGRHQLNKVHFVNPEFIQLLEDFNVGDHLPGKRENLISSGRFLRWVSTLLRKGLKDAAL